MRRYTATDHTQFDQSLKHCPAGAFCRNCMPINDTADTCWAVKTPIVYKIKSYGKIEAKNKADIVSLLPHLLRLTPPLHVALDQTQSMQGCAWQRVPCRGLIGQFFYLDRVHMRGLSACAGGCDDV